jgi:hypothetical protein
VGPTLQSKVHLRYSNPIAQISLNIMIIHQVGFFDGANKITMLTRALNSGMRHARLERTGTTMLLKENATQFLLAQKGIFFVRTKLRRLQTTIKSASAQHIVYTQKQKKLNCKDNLPGIFPRRISINNNLWDPSIVSMHR